MLFGIGSVAAATSASATQLIFTRAFMGIGGALIMPATLSILTNVFRDPKERGRAIAVWAGFSGLGVAIGPMTVALLLEHFSWSSVFWVNLPIGITALVLGAFFVPTSRDPRQSKLDPVGAVLSFVGLATLLFGIIEGPATAGPTRGRRRVRGRRPRALGGFIIWERTRPQPMLDLSVFKNARFSAGSGTITIVFFALFGSLFLMTQYWQLVHGYSPLEAGVHLLPYAVTMMVVAPMSARLVERSAPSASCCTGLTLVTTGLLLLSTIAADSPYPMVISFFMVMAAGMGMTMAPATESVMGALPRSKAGVGSAINDTTRQVGGALGVAIIGSVVSSVYALGSSTDRRVRARAHRPRTPRRRSAPLRGSRRASATRARRSQRRQRRLRRRTVDRSASRCRAVASPSSSPGRFLPSHAEPAYDVLDRPEGSTVPHGLQPAPAPVAGG